MADKKIRYRAQNRMFRKPLLVLQVGIPDVQGLTTHYMWRDATVEDLEEIKLEEQV